MLKIAIYIITTALCLLTGFISSSVTASSLNSWYFSLIKPSFTPPNFLFPIVWSVLYIMMGIAFGIVINSNAQRKKLAYFLFLLQLIFNGAWSFIYFGNHNITLAWIDLNLLFIALILTIRAFYRISKLSAYLLIPYLLWAGFANILNGNIWWLNVYGK